MIIEGLLNLFVGLLEVVFSWVNVPELPASVTAVIDEFFDILAGSVGLLSIFIDFNMVRLLLPVLVIVINFDEAWKLTMFILRKIPFLGMQ